MKLEELGMNRFMYKAPQVNVTESPVYMSATNDSLKNSNSNKDKGNIEKDAKNIITGTVITACLIKSSDQDDRIEIGQNLDSVLSQVDIGSLNIRDAKSLDYLAAYRSGGRLGFILTGVGIVYAGYGMPAVKCINLEQGQTIIRQTTSEVLWTMTSLGAGQYQVNHNLNSLNYSISAIPTSSGAGLPLFADIAVKGLNSFIVDILDVTGSTTASDFDCIVQVFK